MKNKGVGLFKKQVAKPEPNNTMNFNLGLRLYPAQVPRLRIDVTAIGDGQFDFGFSLSYNFSP